MQIKDLFNSPKLNNYGDKNMFNKLEIGDTIRVQILDINKDKMMLKLPDNTILTAQSNTSMDVSKGEFLNLLIKDKQDGQLIVELPKNTANLDLSSEKQTLEQFLKNELIKLDIKPNDKNLEIAKALNQNNMAIDKDTINLIKDSINNNKDLDIQKAIFMINKNIPLTTENIKNINLIQSSGRDIIINNLKSLLQNIDYAMEEFSDEKLNVQNNNDNNQKQISTENKDLNEEIKTIQNLKNNYLNIKDSINNIFKKIDHNNINNLSKEIEYNNISKELSNLIEVFKNIESNNNDLYKEINSSIKNIEKDIDSLNDFNKFQTLINIPININGNLNNAQLYVFKDDKSVNKKIDPSNATIFLSLDTNNLGEIGALVTIVKKSVSINFQMMDNDSVQFTKNNITPLYKFLDAYGYKLTDVTYKKNTEKQDIIEIDKLKEEVSNKQSFDERI